MKLFLTLFTLASSLAFSCPNLSGQYATCVSQTGDNSNTSDVVMTQTIANGITTFKVVARDDESGELEESIMIADGKVRSKTDTDPNSGLTFTEKEAYTCKGAELLGSMSLSLGEDQLVTLNMKVVKSGNSVTISTIGSAMGQAINDLITCQ